MARCQRVKSGPVVDSRRKVNRPLGMQMFGIEPIEIDSLVIPAPDSRVRVYERSVSGLKIIGGHHGWQDGFDSWHQPKPVLTMGRHNFMLEAQEALEEHQLLAELEPVVSQPWCSEVELRDFHEELDEEIRGDAFWSTFEQRLIDSTDDEDLFDSDILDLMDGHPVDAVEVCDDIDAWRHSPDLLDNFDDEVPFIGYFN